MPASGVRTALLFLAFLLFLSNPGLASDCNSNGIPDEFEVPRVAIELIAGDATSYDHFAVFQRWMGVPRE